MGRAEARREASAAARRPKGTKRARNQNGWIRQERAAQLLGVGGREWEEFRVGGMVCTSQKGPVCNRQGLRIQGKPGGWILVDLLDRHPSHSSQVKTSQVWT